jgi:hypothetical protein
LALKVCLAVMVLMDKMGMLVLVVLKVFKVILALKVHKVDQVQLDLKVRLAVFSMLVIQPRLIRVGFLAASLFNITNYGYFQ